MSLLIALTITSCSSSKSSSADSDYITIMDNDESSAYYETLSTPQQYDTVYKQTDDAVVGYPLHSEIRSMNLDELKWENRLLVLWTSSNSSSELMKMNELFAENAAELDERKLVRFALTHHDETTSCSYYNGRFFQELDAKSTDSITEKFDLKNEQNDVLILVGLDGQEKERYQLPVNLQEIFSLIDTMPMRKAELYRGIN